MIEVVAKSDELVVPECGRQPGGHRPHPRPERAVVANGFAAATFPDARFSRSDAAENDIHGSGLRCGELTRGAPAEERHR